MNMQDEETRKELVRMAEERQPTEQAPGETEKKNKKRARPDVNHAERRAPEHHDDDDCMGVAGLGGCGMVTRVVPVKSAEARKPEAQCAVRKEISSIISKVTFDPFAVED